MTQKDDVGSLDCWTTLGYPGYLDHLAKYGPFWATWTTLDKKMVDQQSTQNSVKATF